ncbi:MAG: hypothetical protein Q9191_000347 [Dirinaria sp. TL-2023a]
MMNKHEVGRDPSPYSKRRKLSNIEADASTSRSEADISSWKDLQLLLAFTQETGPEKRPKIRQFKLFLDSIAYGEDRDACATKKKILLDYLRSQSQHREEGNARCFADLLQTWSFAAQSNNEALFSAVAAVLALFFTATSSSLEFRDFGNQLCQILLEDEQLKLFERGLSAKKIKDHVVSPCIRLLTEITSHDGGVAAKTVWRKRDITFKSLEVFIGIGKDPADLSRGDRRKLSLRNNSLRYLFVNLRLQTPAARTGILTLAQGKVVRAVFQDIKQDPPNIILELLQTFKIYVLSDEKLPQHIKKNVFRDGTLLRIASLYNYNEPDKASEDNNAVLQASHSFLLFACTSGKAAILEPIAPVRPRSSNLVDEDSRVIDLTSNAKDTAPTNQGKLTFKNKSVSLFLQGLRPYANVLEKDLVVAVFEAAPELLVDYFQRKKSFSFEPKLTATWLGYSMFLLSAIQLPLPKQYLEMLQWTGNALAIPASTVVETMLPSPLTRKSLTRCLNQNMDLIAFVTLKILIAAFQKFRCLLQWFQNGDSKPPADMRHTTNELRAEFCARCPETRHVIAGFRKCPTDNVAQREAYTRLVALYYSIVPQMALDEKFDISIALSDALLSNDWERGGAKGGLKSLDIQHLQEIALYSPDIRWLHKPDSVCLSSFTIILRHYTQSPSRKRKDFGWTLLESVSGEYRLLQNDEKLPSIDLLIHSLRNCPRSDGFYQFLDQCFQQCYRKSVVYYDTRVALKHNHSASGLEGDGCDVDLLLMAIADQWPFLVQAGTESVVTEATKWLVQYFDLLMHAGRSHDQLSLIRDRIQKNTRYGDCCTALMRALGDGNSWNIQQILQSLDEAAEQEDLGTVTTERVLAHEVLLAEQLISAAPPEEDEDHKALSQWSQESIPEVVLEGTLGELMLCLSSQHAEIRIQTLNALRKLRDKFKHSDWPGAVQTYLLTGELIETVEHFPSQRQFPYVAGVFAARCCHVLIEPLHPLYSKIHKFLNRGPKWNVSKIPSYWMDKILLHSPTEDNGCQVEVDWLLDFLIDGLRTPEDMHIYRRSSLLERLLALATTPSLLASSAEKILQLLYRCTYVDGSTTLITRCGLLSWVQSELALNRNAARRFFLLSLIERTLDTCDNERLNEWSRGNMVNLLANLGIEARMK